MIMIDSVSKSLQHNHVTTKKQVDAQNDKRIRFNQDFMLLMYRYKSRINYWIFFVESTTLNIIQLCNHIEITCKVGTSGGWVQSPVIKDPGVKAFCCNITPSTQSCIESRKNMHIMD